MRRLALIAAALAAVAGAGAAVFLASAPPTSGDGPSSTASKPTRSAEARWSATAVPYRERTDEVVVVHCPPGGTPAVVWGTDVYTDDSSVCSAAVHAGRLTLAGGGTVRIQIGPGKEAFHGSVRNGVATSDYGAWGGSFTFVP